MHASCLRQAIAIMLASAAVAAVDAAPPSYPPQPRDGAIVFTRAQLNADSTLRSSSLWLTARSGSSVRALTPTFDGIHDSSGSWSPTGTRIAFERGSATSASNDRYDIYTVDRRGERLRQLTSGLGNFQTPAWGPGNRIAFVSKYDDRHCLSIVEANGRRQYDLFCPPSPAQLMRPIWSSDGASLYIAAGYYVGSLEPLWRSLAYRVDAATGAAQVLSDLVLGEPLHLEFAPDGNRGIYSDVFVSEMAIIDFATDQVTPIGNGYAPRWSKDGRRIAFTGEVFEDAPEFRYYEPLYVMDADGTHVRRITRARIDNHAYTAVDWSDDGVHVLTNRRVFLDPSLTIPRVALRIVDVETSAVTALPEGVAEPGAWFER